MVVVAKIIVCQVLRFLTIGNNLTVYSDIWCHMYFNKILLRLIKH